MNLTDDGRVADMEDLEAMDALTLLEAVQPEVLEQRRAQLRRVQRANGRGPPPGKMARTSAGGDDEPPAAAEVPPEYEVPPERTVTLSGHEGEVFTCAWNPQAAQVLLASGSGDSTARLWHVAAADGSDAAAAAAVEPIVLRHLAAEGDAARDVTALAWNPSGTLLGTGSADGAARIWTLLGDLQNRLSGHGGPVFALKWSPGGDLVATCSVDHTAIVWDAATGQVQQRFAFHSAPCLDLDWRDATALATCSTDMLVYVCRLGSSVPEHTHRGHTDEVNGVQWAPGGQLLASCSDDSTAKIWSSDQDAAVYTLRHDDKVYSLAWRAQSPSSPPASAGGADAAAPRLLATASFDCTTKVWNARDGTCVWTMRAHSMPVYSVEFSPCGQYLASGSFDHRVLVWSLKSGQAVLSHQGAAGVYEVAWGPDGRRLAACFADQSLHVLSLDYATLSQRADRALS